MEDESVEVNIAAVADGVIATIGFDIGQDGFYIDVYIEGSGKDEKEAADNLSTAVAKLQAILGSNPQIKIIR